LYKFLKLTSAILLIFSCFAHSADKSPSGQLLVPLILETGDTATIDYSIVTKSANEDDSDTNELGIQGASNNEITNNSTISAGGSGIVVDDNATIINTGTILTRSNNSSVVKIGGGTITNEGTISTSFIETKGIFGTGGALTINNTGTISAEDGIYTNNSSITINNNIGGVISGIGWEESRGIYVTNTSATTTIINAGRISGVGTGIYVFGADTTITNTGRIVGTGALSEGIHLKSGGTVTNSGSITGINYGISSKSGTATITNTGTISGGDSDINNNSQLTLYNEQGKDGSDPLTLSGKLPISYTMKVTSDSDYGQLSALSGTRGSMSFDVETTNLNPNLNYTEVLSGVSASQLTDSAGNFTYSGTEYGWELEYQSSTGDWDIDFDSLAEVMTDNEATFPTFASNVSVAFNQTVAVANFAQQVYQCNTFAENNICAAVAGRYTDLNNPENESAAAVLIGGYRFDSHASINVFYDRSVYHSSSNSVDFSNQGPLIGLRLNLQQNEDGTGLQFTAANTYQAQDVRLTRVSVIEDSEPGSGNTDINTETYAAELKYGILLNADTFVNPYVGIQYSMVETDGYTEDDAGSVQFPLTFQSISDETTTIKGGLELKRSVFSSMAYLFGRIGVDHDIQDSGSNQLKASYGSNTLTATLNNDKNETRMNGLVGMDYFITPNQKVTALAHYQELPWGGSSSDAITGFASYTIGF
jgi:hypothetical protein